MSENLRLYHGAIYGLDGVVRRMAADDWDKPSKCAEWSCREVIGHVTWLTRRLAGAVGSGEALPEMPEAEVAGEDPLASWTTARDLVLVGLDRPGALASLTDSPFGEAPIDTMLRISASDAYTHTWDIGAAVGIDPALDPAIAEAILPGLIQFGDNLRQPGLMGPEVEVPADASVVDRYLGFVGRNP
mgnify:CR=1 FL=1